MIDSGEFHDGSFDGLWIDGKTVHLFLSSVDKQRFVVVAHSVAALSAGGIKAGNIVFEVSTRPCNELSADDIAEMYHLKEGEPGKEQALQLIEKARQQKLVLLEVCPSYGGRCVLLARSLSFSPWEDWMHQQNKSRVGDR